MAVNAIGVSAPALTDGVKLKSHATVPTPPTGPLEIRCLGPNVNLVEWGLPESDGGAPLQGYNIAVRDIKKTMWIEVGKVPAGVQRYNIRDLAEDHEYMVRIFARNEIGLSEPLESDEVYKVEIGMGKCTLKCFFFANATKNSQLKFVLKLLRKKIPVRNGL